MYNFTNQIMYSRVIQAYNQVKFIINIQIIQMFSNHWNLILTLNWILKIKYLKNFKTILAKIIYNNNKYWRQGMTSKVKNTHN
jgi:hypothetical protein